MRNGSPILCMPMTCYVHRTVFPTVAVACVLLIGACSSPPSADDTNNNSTADSGASSEEINATDVFETVNVSFDGKPELAALGKIVKQSGGSMRIYQMPPDAPQEVLDNYDPETGPVHVEIDFSGKQVSDAQIAQIAETPAFQEVTDVMLSDTPITDDALQHIAKAQRLRFLTISGTGVTDRGLEHLIGHKNLSFIFLDRWVDGSGITAQAEKRLLRSLPKRHGP